MIFNCLTLAVQPAPNGSCRLREALAVGAALQASGAKRGHRRRGDSGGTGLRTTSQESGRQTDSAGCLGCCRVRRHRSTRGRRCRYVVAETQNS